MKKLKILILCYVFAMLSCAVYAENDAIAVQGAKEQIDDVVFTFMRKSQILPMMFVLTGRPKENFVKNEEPRVIKDLPFRQLYSQLNKKAQQLAEAEGTLARKSGKLNVEEMGKIAEEIQASKNLQTMVEKSRELLKDYPAVAETMELHFATVYDLKTILEGVAETDLNLLDQQSMESLIDGLGSKMSEAELKELMGMVFDDEMEQYKAFVENNKEVLEKVSALAKNGFKVKTVSKKCRTIRGKEFCTSGKEEREIKSLSEIIPYINSMDSPQAIEAPHGEL